MNEKKLYRSIRSRSETYDIRVEIESGSAEEGMEMFRAMREECHKMSRRYKKDDGSRITYEVKFYLTKEGDERDEPKD